MPDLSPLSRAREPLDESTRVVGAGVRSRKLANSIMTVEESLAIDVRSRHLANRLMTVKKSLATPTASSLSSGLQERTDIAAFCKENR